jgi:hypothetical protein
MRMTMWATRSRTARLFIAAGVVGVFAMAGTPRAMAGPLAVCTSDVVDGVEVDYCVANPNADIVTEVPGVNVGFELNFGLGFGS